MGKLLGIFLGFAIAIPLVWWITGLILEKPDE